MDFRIVLEKLLTAFHERGVRYALIGGFALGAWGVPRGTVDVDFLVHREDMPEVDAIMESLGYEVKYRSENVSQYLSPLRIFGEVDCLHAFRAPSLAMLQRIEQKGLFVGALEIRVLRVEDLIGLKVQAMVNNEERRAVDMVDIRALLAAHHGALDWDLMGEYFTLFGAVDVFEELRSDYGPAE